VPRAEAPDGVSPRTKKETRRDDFIGLKREAFWARHLPDEFPVQI